MLASRLVQHVEDRWEPITLRVIEDIRRDPNLIHLSRLPKSELREWGQRILRNLGNWLVAGEETEANLRSEDAGRLRFEEGVPLYEVVHGVNLLKSAVLEDIQGFGTGPTMLELYAEEQVLRLVSRFFDSMTYHIVKGYEAALRRSAHLVMA